MKKTFAALMAFSILASPAMAHEVWVERDAAGPARIYLGEPADPVYPEYWTSPWTMYRVFNNYVDHSPPYDGRPPAPLREGIDYEVSYGASYYESTWRGATGFAASAPIRRGAVSLENSGSPAGGTGSAGSPR